MLEHNLEAKCEDTPQLRKNGNQYSRRTMNYGKGIFIRQPMIRCSTRELDFPGYMTQKRREV